MTNAFHYQNTFDDGLAREFRNLLSSFRPSDLPSLFAWLDGKDDDAITIELGKVTAWLDKSGNSNNATSSVSSGPTKTTEGIYFAGNKYLNWNSIGAFPEECTVIVAAEFASFNSTHSYPIADFDSTGNLARFVFRKLTTGEFNFFSNSGLNLSIAEPAAPQDHHGVYTFNRNASSKEAELYVGGELIGSDDYGVLTTSQGVLNIGRSGSYGTPQYFRGTIHEIIICDGLLSQSDRLKAELYLARKHSLFHENL